MDRAFHKGYLGDIYSKFLYGPLQKEALERLQNCECDALGGYECRCREPHAHAEQNGQLSASSGPTSTYCKLGPAPSTPPIEREIQVTSSNGARNPVKNGVVSDQTQGRHKLVHCDSVDEQGCDAVDRMIMASEDSGLDSAHLALEHTNPITHSRVISLRQEKQRILVRQNTVEPIYDGLRNPYVLVINNVNFFRDPAPRHGATVDWHNLNKFFDKAGFKTVKYYADRRSVQMLSILDNIDQLELCKHDAFICVIMSHGGEKGVMGTDRKYINVEQITARFQADKCPSLATKPKLFFINACRGEMEDAGGMVPRGPHDVVPDDISGELPVKLPSEADFLICYSTTKGHVSYREFFANPADTLRYRNSHRTGSWFISAMVQIFGIYAAKEDLLSMLTRVNRAMCELYVGDNPGSGNKQIACHLSMLTRKLYFMNFLDQFKDSNAKYSPHIM